MMIIVIIIIGEDHDTGYIRFNERQQKNRTKRI